MIDWTNARQIVAGTFFGDKFALLEVTPIADDLNEETELLSSLVGEYDCNIEYAPISKVAREAGIVSPQQMRVSCEKGVPIIRGRKYAVQIISARLQIQVNEVWDVLDWVEGQISTVINCRRREIV
jgi:phosphohistidine swiveling domain-containing protein